MDARKDLDVASSKGREQAVDRFAHAMWAWRDANSQVPPSLKQTVLVSGLRWLRRFLAEVFPAGRRHNAKDDNIARARNRRGRLLILDPSEACPSPGLLRKKPGIRSLVGGGLGPLLAFLGVVLVVAFAVTKGRVRRAGWPGSLDTPFWRMPRPSGRQCILDCRLSPFR